jgi:hypothetical protein
MVKQIDNSIQVKSKKRVSEHGEVFTAHREVNAMLDLVKQETERIESRFLEPACGDGNFLTEILKRKLEIVATRYKTSQLEYERNAVMAVSSIYGVDILKDNVEECRKRLYSVFDERYSSIFKNKCLQDCRDTVKYLLSRNILWGDALSMKTPGEDGSNIIFSEWSTVNGSMMKRRDYSLANLLYPRHSDANTLFSDLGEEAFLPKVLKDYPITHFLKLAANDDGQL